MGKINFVIMCDYAGTKDLSGQTYPEESYVAIPVSISDQHDVLSSLNVWGGIKIAHYVKSRKQAEETAREWNETYKRNGTYFDR